MIPYIVKYDYDDAYGFGAVIVYTNNLDDAVYQFKRYMFNKKDQKWIDHTYRYSDFKHIATNAYGWHTFLNSPVNVVCLKIREINIDHGPVIPIQEHFEIQ